MEMAVHQKSSFARVGLHLFSGYDVRALRHKRAARARLRMRGRQWCGAPRLPCTHPRGVEGDERGHKDGGVRGDLRDSNQGGDDAKDEIGSDRERVEGATLAQGKQEEVDHNKARRGAEMGLGEGSGWTVRARHGDLVWDRARYALESNATA